MMTNQKKKMVLVGIAGTLNDFLLSLHALKCFVYKDIEIKRENIVSGKLKDFSSDFFIFGEAEKPLLALLKFQIGLESVGIEDIKGLSYKEDGLFFCNNESDFIDNLEDTPSPYLEGCVS